MRRRTGVISLREVERSAVGYAGRWRGSGRRSVIATIPIRVRRRLLPPAPSEAQALVRTRVPVVGNVSMDLCTLDVTDVARATGVSVGDEVVLLGAQSAPRAST